MSSEATGTEIGGWTSLPTELREMILECCTWRTDWENNFLAGKDTLSTLTTVCRDWQDFFEKRLFQRITLKTKEDIEIFGSLVQGRRRKFVKWIWLRIELPMYDCETCHRIGTKEDVHVQQAMFTSLVWNLFDVLSSWKIKDVRNDGVTLELSAHSPSDAHHFNKDLRYRLHDTAWDRWDNRPVSPHNDPFHGWKNGRQVKQIPLNSKYRLFGCGLGFEYNLPIVRHLRRRLPRVAVVTSLVIRRQFARTFKAINALGPMIKSLTRLSSFTYEPWRGPTSRYQKKQDWHYAFLAKEAFKARRKSLKKVVIFESHDEIFYRPPYNGSSQRHTTVWFSHGLARSSHNLEELYGANNIDAFHFFFAFHPSALPSQRRWMVWKNLKYLSLTTEHLSPQHGGLTLLMAAKAAERMPKLETMELWNCWARRGIAGFFRFRRGETEASIELVTTWPAKFSTKAKAAWAHVASLQRPLPLNAKETLWNAGIIDGDYSVLQHLELAKYMLHPISLRQIAREDQRRREQRLA